MDREGREERVRNSGIADIPALDDTVADITLESIEEEMEEFHDANDLTNPPIPDDDPPAGAVGGPGAGAADRNKHIVTPPQL